MGLPSWSVPEYVVQRSRPAECRTMPLAHVAAVRLDGCWEAICWRARGALIRLFERPMSDRLALGELHTVLQREAREARQFETNALSLLFKPCAQGRCNADHDLVRYS